MIVDTHCHLDDLKYAEDLQEVIERSFASGVEMIVIPGADIADLPRAKEIAHSHPNIYFAAGVHPYHHSDFDADIIYEYAKDEKCIAIGECGLDYYRLPEDKEAIAIEKRAQKEIFIKHIDIAKELDLPLIVHIRDANDDSKQILLENGANSVGGVLHCYNASKHLLDLSEKGFYFGIGGVVTFKNAKALVEVLPQIPLEKIVLETDAPYLTPHPHRGKRNEPSYTTFVAQNVAQILQIPLHEVEQITTQNAQRLFKGKLG
jgi:TatD DNase family protein